MPTHPHVPNASDLHPGRLGGPADDVSHAAFSRSEILEMRSARLFVLRRTLPWAPVGAAGGGAMAWLAALGLDPAFRWLAADWLAPALLVCLSIGLACGALGGIALAGLVLSFFEEDRDIPAAIVPAVTAGAIAGCLFGAGHGGGWALALGLAVGLLLGSLVGVFAYFTYWAAQTAAVAVRDALRGY